MGHSQTGVIYKPVDFQTDVAAVLGRNTGDGGQLCGDVDENGVAQNTIKFWSLRKPIRYNKKEELTDAEWKAANYGYTINSYYGNSGVLSLIADHKAGASWLYLKPRGESYYEHFRITDFDGYEGNANESPFVLDINDQPEIGGSARVDITFLEDFLNWGLFSAYAPTFANLYLGLLAWPASSANPQSCHLLPITSSRSGMTILDHAQNERFSYPVSSNVFTNGTQYILRPVIMTYDAGDNYGTWIPVNAYSTPTISGYLYDILCPEITVTPKNQVTPDQRVNIFADGDNAVYSGDFPMDISSVPFYISNGNGSALTGCSLYVYFKDYTYSAQGQDVELGHINSFTINANTSDVLKTVTGNISIMPATYRAQGRYEFTFTYNGSTYTKRGTFYIGEK